MRSRRRKGGKGKGKGKEGANLRSEKNIARVFKVTFKPSLIFSTLRFTIRNSRPFNRKNVIIKKIIIIGENWMNDVMEDDLPYTIPSGHVTHFFIDSDFLKIKERYPVFIFYTFEDNQSLHMIEQFFFLKSDDYPLRSSRIPRNSENTMKFYEVDNNFPSKNIEELSSKKFFTTDELIPIEPAFENYLKADKTLTMNNISAIFKSLIQLEDASRYQKYQVLKQEDCEIQMISEMYHLALNDLPEDINPKDIIKPYDEIRIIKQRSITYMGVIDKIVDTDVYFSLRDNICKLSEGKYNVSFFPNRTNFMVQYVTIKKLSSFRNELEDKSYFYNILFPEPRSAMISADSTSFDWFSKSVKTNPEQMEAVRNIVGGTHGTIPYIIFGPPGTGKTTTIVEAILQLSKANSDFRILVTAGSNAACDEIGVRINKQIGSKSIKVMYRVYAQSVEKRIDTLNEDLKLSSNLADNHHFYPSLNILENYRIIIVTLTVSGKFILGDMQPGFFSHIFIDECAASTEPESLIPIVGLMTSKTRLILSGDPKQLGPVLENKIVDDLGLGVSLIERLLQRKCYEVDSTGQYNRSIQTRLVQNYRTHPDILYLSNHLYYDNQLKACASEEITHWGLNWYKLPSKSFPIIFDVVYGETVTKDHQGTL